MTPPPSEWENYLLDLINASRAEAGAGALSFDAELAQAAGDHSAWMLSTDTFSHTGEGGSSPAQRVSDAGYDYRTTGENIGFIAGPAVGTLDAADVELLHANLMDSPGHRANLLNPNYTEIGLGIEQGDYRGYPAVVVTENFGRPTGSEAAEADAWFI